MGKDELRRIELNYGQSWKNIYLRNDKSWFLHDRVFSMFTNYKRK